MLYLKQKFFDDNRGKFLLRPPQTGNSTSSCHSAITRHGVEQNIPPVGIPFPTFPVLWLDHPSLNIRISCNTFFFPSTVSFYTFLGQKSPLHEVYFPSVLLRLAQEHHALRKHPSSLPQSTFACRRMVSLAGRTLYHLALSVPNCYPSSGILIWSTPSNGKSALLHASQNNTLVLSGKECSTSVQLFAWPIDCAARIGQAAQ